MSGSQIFQEYMKACLDIHLIKLVVQKSIGLMLLKLAPRSLSPKAILVLSPSRGMVLGWIHGHEVGRHSFFFIFL